MIHLRLAQNSYTSLFSQTQSFHYYGTQLCTGTNILNLPSSFRQNKYCLKYPGSYVGVSVKKPSMQRIVPAKDYQAEIQFFSHEDENNAGYIFQSFTLRGMIKFDKISPKIYEPFLLS